jgi:hypothetical protein
MGLMLYRVLAASGGFVNGQEVAIGSDVAMTPEEAAYEVDAGNVLPTGIVPSQPPDPPVIQGGDLVLTRRGLFDRDVDVGALEAFLVRDAGGISAHLARRDAALEDALGSRAQGTIDGLFAQLLDGAGADRNTLAKLGALIDALSVRLLGGADTAHDTLDKLGKLIEAQAASVATAIEAAALTQTLQDLVGPPSDLAPGKHRMVWNTAANRISVWVNRGGVVSDAFDPGTF